MANPSWPRLWEAAERYRIALTNLNGYQISVNMGNADEQVEADRWTEELAKAEHALYAAAGAFRRSHEHEQTTKMINEAFERHQREMGRSNGA